MRLPGPNAFTGWRRVAVPVAMLSVATAVSTGLASTSASGSGPGGSRPVLVDTNAPDPEVENQAATLVLAPANDDNFTPPGACGGTSVAPSRCTAAVWVVNRSSHTLSYSTTACSTSPSLQALVLTGNNIPECSATPFVPAAPAPAAAPTPGAPVPVPVPVPVPAPVAAASQAAITGFPGARCIPSDCRLFLVLAQADGDFNAPGLCGGTADIVAPCMVASFDTVGAVGGATISQPNTACPASGDATVACTANPAFFPASMRLTLPAKATAAPATPPVHGPEVLAQAATLVVAPVGDNGFDPPNTCGTWGVNPVGRCTAAVFSLTATDTSAAYASASCPIDIAADVSPCTSAAFQPSVGGSALSSLPGSLCYGATPAATAAVPNPTAPVVNCHVFVVLTPKDGDLNAPGICLGYFLISSACTMAVVDTSTGDQAGGAVVKLTSTSLCVEPPGDPDISLACTAASFAPKGITVTLPKS
jgi:hypothetical protein